jgi:hypothetical protein
VSQIQIESDCTSASVLAITTYWSQVKHLNRRILQKVYEFCTFIKST